MRQITVARTAGFCFGVERAISICQQLIDSHQPACTLGEIIHNPDVVRELEQKGLRVVHSLDDVPPDTSLVIRSHGVPRAITEDCLRRGIGIVDATCIFVSKIHRIVEECSAANRTVLIAGDALHPEVQGILGYCTSQAFVVSSIGQLQDAVGPLPTDHPLALVAQTTFHVHQYREFIDLLNICYTNVQIFDTICSATQSRQEEAEKLAKSCDICVVIGGRNSSNTGKLYEVCSQFAKTYRIESPGELKSDMFEGASSIGITAGASTPSAIIQEVYDKMSNIGTDDDFNFEEALESSVRLVHRGQRIEGIVTSIHPNEVVVDIGTKHTGFIPIEELQGGSSQANTEPVQVGDKLRLVVTSVHDQEGYVILSKKRLDSEAGMGELAKGVEEGTVFDAYITEAVNKGLIAMVKGIRVFIPASQATVRRGEPYEQLAKTRQKIRILEVNPERRRAIGSIRAVAEEERKKLRDAFWSTAEVGKRYSGTIKSITSYGAFIDLGGIDGMLHKSEMSWDRVNRLDDLIHVGDVLDVYIKELNMETQKISLGYRDEADNPWTKLGSIPLGTLFEAPVVSVTSFGAFVRIMPGIDGLVHTSEISSTPVRDASEVIKVGDTVMVRLIGIDADRHRVSLSMRPQSENDLSDEESED